jgi:hypothetical protein
MSIRRANVYKVDPYSKKLTQSFKISKAEKLSFIEFISGKG